MLANTGPDINTFASSDLVSVIAAQSLAFCFAKYGFVCTLHFWLELDGKDHSAGSLTLT